MGENISFSLQGIPRWFSPEHAAEKFGEIAKCLGKLADEASHKKVSARTLRAIQETAQKYANYYSQESPIRSVRIMRPSGAIFVILADGREVMVPQPDREE